MKFMFIDDLLWLATVLCELLEGTNRIIYVVRVVDVNKWIFLSTSQVWHPCLSTILFIYSILGFALSQSLTL